MQASDVLKADSYTAKLGDPRWHAKRDSIMRKRGVFCENCKRSGIVLQLHHNFYDRGKEPWEYDDSVFKVLCKACHERFTEALKAFRRDALPKYDIRSMEVITGAMSVAPRGQKTLQFAYAVAWLAAHPDLAQTLCEKWQHYELSRKEVINVS